MNEHRTPTHESLDLDTQWDLGDALADAAEDAPVTHAMIEAVANAQGVPPAQVYIGAALDPLMEWEEESDVALWVCAGACQHYGAGEILERLLALREEHLSGDKPPFHIIPRGCLSVCERGPVMVSHSAHGEVTHPNLELEGLDEIVKLLLSPA